MMLKTQSLVLSPLLIAVMMSWQTPLAASPRPQEVCTDAKASAGEKQAGTEGAFINEKRNRTEAQKKIDSQLLYALKQKRGETRGVPTEPIVIKLDDKGRVLVDISARVSTRLVAEIEKLGATVISRSERYHTIRASVALEKLEALASLKDVRFVAPAARAITHGAKTN